MAAPPPDTQVEPKPAVPSPLPGPTPTKPDVPAQAGPQLPAAVPSPLPGPTPAKADELYPGSIPDKGAAVAKDDTESKYPGSIPDSKAQAGPVKDDTESKYPGSIPDSKAQAGPVKDDTESKYPGSIPDKPKPIWGGPLPPFGPLPGATPPPPVTGQEPPPQLGGPIPGSQSVQSAATYPTIAQDQPDTFQQINQLIQRGQSPGAAQAIVNGQQPKTLTGQTPPASKPAPPPEQQPESMEAAEARYEAERAKLQQPAAQQPAQQQDPQALLKQAEAQLTDQERTDAQAYDNWDWSKQGDPPPALEQAYNKRAGIMKGLMDAAGVGGAKAPPNAATSTVPTEPGTVSEGKTINGTSTVFALNYDGSPDTQDNGQGFFKDANGKPIDTRKAVGVAVPWDILEQTFGKFTAPDGKGGRVALDTPEAKAIIAKIQSAHVELTDDKGKIHKFPIVDIQGSIANPAHTGKVLDMTLGATKEMGYTDNHHVSYQIVGGDGNPYPVPDISTLPAYTGGGAHGATPSGAHGGALAGQPLFSIPGGGGARGSGGSGGGSSGAPEAPIGGGSYSGGQGPSAGSEGGGGGSTLADLGALLWYPFLRGAGRAPVPRQEEEEEAEPAMKQANVLGVRTVGGPPAAPGAPALPPAPPVPVSKIEPPALPAPSGATLPIRPQAQASPAKPQPAKPQPAKPPALKAPPAPAAPTKAPAAPVPTKQAPPQPVQATRIGPPGSTVGVPNPAGGPSPDDPRVKKQRDNMTKGEHFVPGDDYHEQLLSGLPYGKSGRQRQILGQAEQAIADRVPMHISYISAPKEAAKFPTRESRTIQYEAHSPEARLMGTTEGQLVGHSLIPTAVGISPSRKEGEPHQGYIQGISTNVMANNFAHIVTKLAAMGHKTPYIHMGPKFAADLQGYLANLNAGHTGTGRGYAVGTEAYPSTPDETHVPYKLTRGEADFLNLVLNNTGAFAKHADAQALRELARANGTLINEKGETNRLRHRIEQNEPGWRERVLEPTIRSFKAGLIHEVHPSEEGLPQEIRPGKDYRDLTQAMARTIERGRPDVPVAVSLHHTFADNRAINQIERDFSEERINEAQARERLHAMGEDPDEYRFIGGSGGLITPYEDDPESITPEEHTQLKTNLRKAWVGGKMPIEDYRRKAAEVPLPEIASRQPEQGESEEASATPAASTPAPKPKPPKPEPTDPGQEILDQPPPGGPGELPEEEEQSPSTAPAAPPAAPSTAPSRAEPAPAKKEAYRGGGYDPQKHQGISWFTSDQEAAHHYAARAAEESGEESPNVGKYQLSIKNPFDASQPVTKPFLAKFRKHWNDDRRERGLKELEPDWEKRVMKDYQVGLERNRQMGLDDSIFNSRGVITGGRDATLAKVLSRMGHDAIRFHGPDPIKHPTTGEVYRKPYEQLGVFKPEQVTSAEAKESPGAAPTEAKPAPIAPPAPGEPLPAVKPGKKEKVKTPEQIEDEKKEEDRRQAAIDRADISPERQAGMTRLNKRAKTVAKQLGEVDPLSMHAHLTGQRAFPGKLKNEQIGEYYDANNPKLDYENEDHRERASHAVYHDIVHALAGTTTGGQPSDAYGWYDETVKKSLKKTGEIAPKILKDPVHELAWKLALAITSQGQDVYPNAESSWHAYRHWMQNGAKEGGLPESREIFGGGLKAEQMEENFRKVNALWKELGTEKFKKLLMKRMTVGDLKKKFPGLDVPGELANHTVNGAMFMGPKIGAFFSNLYGDYEPTTMDLWFSRNMNLMAGNMFKFSDEAARVDRMEKGKLVKSHLSQLKDALDSGMLTSVDEDQAKKMSAELSALMAHPEGKLDRPTALALAPTIYDWAKGQHRVYQRSYGSGATSEEQKGSYHPDFKTPENLTAKKLDEATGKLSDSPRNGTERFWWRNIMDRATNKLKAVGLKLTNADKQALLWFVIKDLFRKAGSPQRDKADYLDAAYTLVRKVKEGALPGLPSEQLENLPKAA